MDKDTKRIGELETKAILIWFDKTGESLLEITEAYLTDDEFKEYKRLQPDVFVDIN